MEKKDSQIPNTEQTKEQQWLAFRSELRDLRTKILKKLAQINDKQILNQYFQREAEFVDRLRVTGMETETVLAWHVLAQGGTSYTSSPILDFPGEYSVKKFFQSALDKINQSN